MCVFSMASCVRVDGVVLANSRLTHMHPSHTVLNAINYTGVHTSRAARIEPITPPGSVYVSQAFAAIAETLRSAKSRIQCQYVGNVPLAKAYGLQPVYHLRWSHTAASSELAVVHGGAARRVGGAGQSMHAVSSASSSAEIRSTEEQ